MSMLASDRGAMAEGRLTRTDKTSLDYPLCPSSPKPKKCGLKVTLNQAPMRANLKLTLRVRRLSLRDLGVGGGGGGGILT